MIVSSRSAEGVVFPTGLEPAILSGTGTQSRRVYQFRHRNTTLGVRGGPRSKREPPLPRPATVALMISTTIACD
jgi:hypothetical protein